MLAPVTNPVVKVKDVSRNPENNHPSYIYGPPVSGTTSSPEADDLRNIIEQIRSLNIEREQPPVTENKVQKTEDRKQKTDDGVQRTEDSNVLSVISPPSPALRSEAKKGQSSELSDQVLQQVNENLKDPNHIANPLQLAEILFKIGKLGPAAVCYKQALTSIAPDDPASANERAWILFQIGNCLKFDDPNAAKDSFAQLLRTYPDSPWSDAAKTCHELTAFLQQENPDKLILDFNPPAADKPVH
jgi:tetratricopeptide (TPR) repeat protein